MKYYVEIKLNDLLGRIIHAESMEWCVKNLGGLWREATKEEVKNNPSFSGYMEKIYKK